MDRAVFGSILLVALCLALGLVRWRRGLTSARRQPARLRGRQAWRPRTPADCAVCRAGDAGRTTLAPAAVPVRPWAEVKSRRGAPKRRATAGYACPSPACPYFGITDARVHALIAFGYHGTTDRIQDLRCQACGSKVSARRGTALYQLKTSPRRRASSATARTPSRGGWGGPGGTPVSCTSACSGRCTCHTCNWTRSAPAYARADASSGSGWRWTR
jgi:hypothetical protein